MVYRDSSKKNYNPYWIYLRNSAGFSGVNELLMPCQQNIPIGCNGDVAIERSLHLQVDFRISFFGSRKEHHKKSYSGAAPCETKSTQINGKIYLSIVSGQYMRNVGIIMLFT